MPTSAKTFPTPDCRRVTLRRAGHADHEAVATLLREVDLPTPGVAEWLDRFWIAELESQVVAVAGMELYGDSGSSGRSPSPLARNRCSCSRGSPVARNGCRTEPGVTCVCRLHHRSSRGFRMSPSTLRCANGCRRKVITMSGSPMAAGSSQYATVGSSRQSGRCAPLST
jgi:hypothetical protein